MAGLTANPQMASIAEDMINNIKTILPSLTKLVQDFNKNLKLTDAVKFGSTFPMIISATGLCLEVMQNLAQEYPVTSMKSINEFVSQLSLRDGTGKIIVDSNGNAMSIFAPMLSMTKNMVEMMNAISWKDIIMMPINMLKLDLAFNSIFKWLAQVLDKNETFLKGITASKTIKETVEDAGKNASSQGYVEPGTGGAFKEIVVMVQSMQDVCKTFIEIAKKSVQTFASIKILNLLYKDIFELIEEKLLTAFDRFNKIISDNNLKGTPKNWEMISGLLKTIVYDMAALGPIGILGKFGMWVMSGVVISLRDLFAALVRTAEYLNNKKLIKAVREAQLNMMMITTNIILTATVMYIGAKLVKENFTDIMLGFGEILLCTLAIVGIMKLIEKFFSVGNMKDQMMSLTLMTTAMMMLSGVLFILGVVNTKYLGKALIGLLGITLISLGILTLLKFIQIGVNKVLGGWKDIAMTLGTLTLSMILMTGVLWIIDKMFEEVPVLQLLKDLLILAGVALVSVLIIKMIEESNIGVKSIFAILAMSVGLLGIAYALKIVADSVNGGMDIAGILLFTGVTMALVGMFIAVGTIMMTGVGAAAVYAAVSAFLVIGASVYMLAHSFEIIIDSIEQVVNLMQDEEKMSAGLAGIPKLIGAFINGIMSVPITTLGKAIVKANAMALAIGPAAHAISKMVGVIKDMADGQFAFTDPKTGETVQYNVIEMMNGGMLDNIGATLTSLIGGFATAIASIDWNTAKRVIHRAEFMEELGNAVGPVYDLIEMVKSLAGGTITIDGEEVDLMSWIQDNEANISQTISSLVMGFMNAMAMGMGVDGAEDWWDDVFEEYMDAAKDGLEEVPDVIEYLLNMQQSIDKLCTGFEGMGVGLDLLPSNITQMCTGIMDWYDKTPNIKNVSDMVDVVDDMVDISEGFANISKNLEGLDVENSFDPFVDGNVKFIDGINKLNTSKANALANVFEKLADLSDSLNGNFDKLADAISDKLINALTDLTETLDRTNSGEDGLGSRLRAMTGKFTSGIGNMVGGVMDVFDSDDRHDREEEKERNENLNDHLENILEELRDINDTLLDGVKVSGGGIGG